MKNWDPMDWTLFFFGLAFLLFPALTLVLSVFFPSSCPA